ncbi:hypothetical protein TNCV_1282781 [Trichonephila clavipes]|uniref:Uncharacterized protein n=1 Tax=Trichonephila clavipes TaxID=2585209 RepID=A0A8X6SQL0_TRICX|nr:hypothetical protein TNCV_1282781 [Trichonephila clavipes]
MLMGAPMPGKYVMLSCYRMIMRDHTHRDRIVDTYLEQERIQRMQCSARSLDLKPNEHVWNYLGRRVDALNYLTRIVAKLSTALEEQCSSHFPQN